MKLWFRMIGYFIAIQFMPKLENVLSLSRLKFRVWPTDMDTSLHMNNGRYLTLMDLGRLDVMARTPLFAAVLRNGWTPVVSTATIRFRRELRLFEPFFVETQIIAWSDTTVVFEQKLVFSKGPRKNTVAAYALIRAGLYDRKNRKFNTVKDLMAETDFYPEIPTDIPVEVEKFLELEEVFSQSQRTRNGRLSK